MEELIWYTIGVNKLKQSENKRCYFMDMIMLIGIIIFVVGLLINVANAKWSWKTGAYTASKNRIRTLLGWLLITIGLAIVIVTAYNNGQLG